MTRKAVRMAEHVPLIFVSGASRSGTTLVSFILRRHPMVLGLPELQFFGDGIDPRRTPARIRPADLVRAATLIFERHERGVRMARREPVNEEEVLRQARRDAYALVRDLPADRQDLVQLFAQATALLARRQRRRIVCEQTPRNIFYAEALLSAYPEARFVHVVRDPRGVMASQKRRWRRRDLLANRAALPVLDAVRAWANYHPYTMATLWQRATREAQRLADHPRFLMIRFEDLLTEPETVVRRVCEHVRLDYFGEMLDVAQVNSSHQSSASGPRRGFNPAAIDAWRLRLSPGEVRIVERLCGADMRTHGYPPAADPAGDGLAEARYALSYAVHALGVLALNPRRAWIQLNAIGRRRPNPGAATPHRN